MDTLSIIYKYYPEDNALRRLLIHHSCQVAARACEVAARHPELHLDGRLLHDGAMLHDVGIFQTDAPGIGCHGRHHYLLHGYLGAQLMRQEGCEELARICERHTGTGLTRDVCQRRGIELPPGEYCPQSMEEKVVCYADKFFSKSHPFATKTAAQVCDSLRKFGEEGVEIFKQWHEIFG